MKKNRMLFGFITVLGIIFLTISLLSTYLSEMDSLNILASLYPNIVFPFLILGGIGLLTVGIIGIGRLRLKKHKNLFTAIVAVVIPPLTFALILLFTVWIIFPATWFPLRSEITQVSVIDTNPLVLSLEIQAITSRDSRIDSVIITNDNDEIVASYSNEEIKNSKGVITYPAIAELPAGSKIEITIPFNTTLPSGDYIVLLSSWHDGHDSSPFTIP